MATKDNLQEAFAGESQANRRYLAFAKKAKEDGYPQIAKLFRAVAEAETIHAHAHMRAAGAIKDTAANLEQAISGEHFEFTEMYPGYIEEAESEGNQPAAFSFKNAMAVEEIHHGLYAAALEPVKSGKDLSEAGISVCPVCGNTIIGGVEIDCPICGVSKDKFVEIQ